MGIETNTKARLHQHLGRVALRIGENQTVYLSTELAKNLAKELALAAKQTSNDYHYPTTEVTG